MLREGTQIALLQMALHAYRNGTTKPDGKYGKMSKEERDYYEGCFRDFEDAKKHGLDPLKVEWDIPYSYLDDDDYEDAGAI